MPYADPRRENSYVPDLVVAPPSEPQPQGLATVPTGTITNRINPERADPPKPKPLPAEKGNWSMPEGWEPAAPSETPAWGLSRKEKVSVVDPGPAKHGKRIPGAKCPKCAVNQLYDDSANIACRLCGTQLDAEAAKAVRVSAAGKSPENSVLDTASKP